MDIMTESKMYVGNVLIIYETNLIIYLLQSTTSQT